MCGRYYIDNNGRRTFGKKETDRPSNPLVLLERYLAGTTSRNDVRPMQSVPILRATGDVVEAQWWLVPNLPFVQDPAGFRKKYTTFNAKVETLGPKSRLYGPAWKAGQRCIFPMSGYYEWEPIVGSKKKQRYAIGPEDGRMLFAAGLWDHWEPHADRDGLPLDSCTMIVQPAAENLKEIHDRSPFLIPEDLVEEWLTVAPDRALELLQALELPRLGSLKLDGPVEICS